MLTQDLWHSVNCTTIRKFLPSWNMLRNKDITLFAVQNGLFCFLDNSVM